MLNILIKMKKIEILEKEVSRIKERNKRVEIEKSWETSWIRIILIAILTYLVMVIFFYFAQLPKPFINSIVPSMAFVLSTLSFPFFKKIWIKYKNLENKK